MENGDALYARIAELERCIRINLAVHKCPWCKEGACECDCDNCYITGCFECVGGGYGKEEDLNLCKDCANAYHSDSEEEEEVLEDLTPEQLRNRLRAMNKPVSGCKARLIKRIRDHEQLKEALFEED